MEHEALSMWQWVGAFVFLAVPVVAGALLGIRMGKAVEHSQRDRR